MSEIKLEGVRSEPFISYLKALGLIRIVSSQNDPTAICRWENGCFFIESEMDRDQLIGFFLDEYSPTPIANPWNGGSGFSPGEDTTSIDKLLLSDNARFRVYSDTLNKINEVLGKKDSLPACELIDSLVTVARNSLGEEWQERLSAQDFDFYELEPLKKNDKESLELLREFIKPLSKLKDQETRENLMKLTCEQIRIQTNGLNGKEKESIAIHRSIEKALRKIRTKSNQTSRSGSKTDIISSLRNELSDVAIEWMDTAVQIDDEGELRTFPILGSGGNEGRLEYGKTFMDDVCMLIMPPGNESKAMLESALFGSVVQNLPKAAVGYFDPGRTGGFNQGPGIENKDFPVNPWDFVLAMEGAIVWSGNLTRRFKVGASVLSSPFTVRSSGIGYSSASKVDSESARAEIWIPIWNRPTGYRELKSFISEGRADVGRGQPRDGLDFADAVSSLSVDRGIEEFVRYGVLKRRGDSYVALPLGNFSVRYRSEADLIREAKGLINKVEIFNSKKAQPSSQLESGLRNVEEGMMIALKRGGPSAMKEVLIEIGRLERNLCSLKHDSDDRSDKPISGLSTRWLMAADDGSLEFRLAASLASIRRTGEVGSMRSNLGHVSANGWDWDDSQQCWSGNSLKSRLAGVLRRRIIDAKKLGLDRNPLYGELALNPQDVSLFIDGKADLAIVEDLIFGLCWVKWEQLAESQSLKKELIDRWATPTQEYFVNRVWAVMKLTFMPGEVRIPSKEATVLPANLMTLSLLQAGRIEEAFEIVTKELFLAGYQKLNSSVARGNDTLDIMAALLVPVRIDFPNSIGIKQMLNID